MLSAQPGGAMAYEVRLAAEGTDFLASAIRQGGPSHGHRLVIDGRGLLQGSWMPHARVQEPFEPAATPTSPAPSRSFVQRWRAMTLMRLVDPVLWADPLMRWSLALLLAGLGVALVQARRGFPRSAGWLLVLTVVLGFLTVDAQLARMPDRPAGPQASSPPAVG
jgi:hypothetical protein